MLPFIVLTSAINQSDFLCSIIIATTDIRFDVPLNITVVTPKGVQGK